MDKQPDYQPNWMLRYANPDCLSPLPGDYIASELPPAVLSYSPLSSSSPYDLGVSGLLRSQQPNWMSLLPANAIVSEILPSVVTWSPPASRIDALLPSSPFDADRSVLGHPSSLAMIGTEVPSIDKSGERLDALTKRIDGLVDEVHKLRTESTYWQSQALEAERQMAMWRERARKAELQNLRLNQERIAQKDNTEVERLKAENAKLKRTLLAAVIDPALSEDQDIEPPGKWDDYLFGRN